MIVKNILTGLDVETAQAKIKPLRVGSETGGSSETTATTVFLDKGYKLSDGGGLSLIVNPNGSKWWHFRYRFDGKEGKISLGVYPEVSLEEARAERDKCQSELNKGINPSTSRKEARRASQQIRINTFRVVTNKWLTEIFPLHSKSPDHAKRVRARFENDLFPLLGDRLIKDITTQEVLAAIQRIEGRGCHETAQRTLGSCSDVFQYAKTLGYCQHDVTEGIFSLLKRPVLGVLNQNGLPDFPDLHGPWRSCERRRSPPIPSPDGSIQDPGRRLRCGRKGRSSRLKNCGESILRAITKAQSRSHPQEQAIPSRPLSEKCDKLRTDPIRFQRLSHRR